MNIQETYQLIARLKHQPKHGAGPPGDLNDAAGLSADNILSIGSIAANAALSVAKLTTSLAGLNNAMLIGTGYEKAAAGVQTLNKYYKDLIQPALYLEKLNKKLNAGFGITSDASAGLAQELQKVATQYKFTSDQAKAYAVNIKTMLPLMNQTGNANTKFYQGLQKTQNILVTNLGFTNEQANAYTQYAAAQSDSADATLMVAKRVAEAFGDNAQGDLGYFSMITHDIAEAGAETQLQYGKIPGSLESAVIKSKKFGLSLHNLESAANNLLNIESSIGQELEYQLLSGHRLIDQQSGKSLTNLYREATLRGEANTQADIMNSIIEQEGEVLTNNLFARKQMAGLLGIEEKQLASALQKKQILDKAAEQGITINLDGSDALQQAAAAVEAGALSPEDFEALKKATDTRTTDEILDQILTVNEEQLFYDKLINQQAITKAISTSGINNVPNLEGLDVSYDTLKTMGAALLAKRGFNAMAGLPLATANAATNVTTGHDVVIPPGSSKAILMGPDQINLRDDDMVIAGTNLGGGTNIDNMQQFAAMIVAAINNQTTQLKSGDRVFSGGINAPYYG